MFIDMTDMKIKTCITMTIKEECSTAGCIQIKYLSVRTLLRDCQTNKKFH